MPWPEGTAHLEYFHAVPNEAFIVAVLEMHLEVKAAASRPHSITRAEQLFPQNRKHGDRRQIMPSADSPIMKMQSDSSTKMVCPVIIACPSKKYAICARPSGFMTRN
jgi:hypothetical protein